MFKWGSTFLSGGLSSQNPRHSSSAFCPKSTTPPLHRAPCGQLPNHQFDKVNMLPSEPAFSDPIYRDLQSTLYIPKKETAPLLNQPPSLFPGHLKPPLPEAGFGPEKADIPPAGPEDLPNRSVQPDTGETPAIRRVAVSPCPVHDARCSRRDARSPRRLHQGTSDLAFTVGLDLGLSPDRSEPGGRTRSEKAR